MKKAGKPSASLYSRVAEDIALQISSGALQPGGRLPSEHAMCERYQVSQITIRRALRELAYEGRVYSQHGLGWFVTSGPAQATGNRNVVLVLPDLQWEAAALVRYCADELAVRGSALQVAFTEGRAEAEATALAAAHARGVDAALLVAAGPERQAAPRYQRLIEAADLPVLLLLRDVPGVKAPVAALDEGLCIEQTTRHLLNQGHRRLAYAGSDPAQIGGQRRYRGFAAALWEQSLELPLEWLFLGRLTDDEQLARFRRVFDATIRPTALVCASDCQAAEALSLLPQVGLRCPEDIAIVGMGDYELAGFLSTPLTTFRLGLDELARAAVSMAFDLLAGRTVQNAHVSGQLVVRASCGASQS